MNPKLKNAIIFIVIGIVVISVYFVFIKKPSASSQANLAVVGETAPLANTDSGAVANNGQTNSLDDQLSKDFLSVLLSIKNINLDDSIFSNVAFTNLKDSTILLLPDGSEGRPNPFAPIGTENNIVPATVLSNFGNTDLKTEAKNDSLFGPDDGLLTETEPAPAVKTTPATPKKP